MKEKKNTFTCLQANKRIVLVPRESYLLLDNDYSYKEQLF